MCAAHDVSATIMQIERMDLVGTVDGSDVVIVDDMIDTAGTLCAAAAALKNNGGACAAAGVPLRRR